LFLGFVIYWFNTKLSPHILLQNYAHGDQHVKVVSGVTCTKNVESVRFIAKGGDVVTTSQLALHWMGDSSRMGCAWRATPVEHARLIIHLSQA